MAYYRYYQNGNPYWGTNNYQFQAPPIPSYVPQPSWSGADYYSAHAGVQDSSLFDYVRSRFRSLVSGGYVPRAEAELCHRQVYGGLAQISTLLPREIGAAAGWETLRLWQSHTSIYRAPLAGEREREREAVIGLATAEASRLWQYTGRPMDRYGRREACEVAAATATRLLYDYDSSYDDYSYSGRGRRRSSSFVAPDVSDYGSMTGSYRSPSPIPIASGYRAPSPIPMQTVPIQPGGSPYNAPALLPGAQYGTQYGTQVMQPGGVSPYAAPMSLSASPYQSQFYGQPSGGLSYDQQYAMAAAPGTVIIHSDSGRSHHHHHRSSSRHHHRSSSRHHRSRSRSRYE